MMLAAGSQPTRVLCDRVSSLAGERCEMRPGPRLRLRHIRFRSKVRWKVREAVMRVVLLGENPHPRRVFTTFAYELQSVRL